MPATNAVAGRCANAGAAGRAPMCSTRVLEADLTFGSLANTCKGARLLETERKVRW
jgi:hypothetical protein